MNQREQIKTTKTIKLICGIVEKAKQKTIKRIIRRLNKMSPNDVQDLARMIKA